MRKVYNSKYDGWTVTDSIDIGNDRRLDITTRKDGKNVSTFATVSTVGDGFISHTIFKDFYKKYQTYAAKRVTEKTVIDIHNFVSIDSITADAIAFYG